MQNDMVEYHVAQYQRRVLALSAKLVAIDKDILTPEIDRDIDAF